MEAAVSSDHAPLVMRLTKPQRRNKGNKGFRYEAGWTLEEGYKEMITTVWEKESMQPMGWDRLNKKLYKCKQQISLWKDTLQRPKIGPITHMREKLVELQGLEDMGNSDEIAQLKHAIRIQLEKDDLWWRHRAKLEWLK